jgi:hypothetical protein
VPAALHPAEQLGARALLGLLRQLPQLREKCLVVVAVVLAVEFRIVVGVIVVRHIEQGLEGASAGSADGDLSLFCPR